MVSHRTRARPRDPIGRLVDAICDAIGRHDLTPDETREALAHVAIAVLSVKRAQSCIERGGAMRVPYVGDA